MSDPLLPVRPDGQVIVTGSLAFDQIMTFPGFFKDHILPDKLHLINISFLVSEMRKQRGGCSGNIAYTMALLGENSRVIATAGKDFADYEKCLADLGVDTSGIRTIDDELTASCFITTDKSNNQITGFFIGAMAHAKNLSLREMAGDRAHLCIIAPDDPDAMIRHSREAREMGLPFIFDPSFQVTAMNGEQLAAGSEGAMILMTNDYEHSVFEEKTGKKGRDIFDLVDIVVVTLGGEGSRILRKDADEIRVPAAKIRGVADPTGAGDSYRAGFCVGLMRGLDLATCARLGTVAAAYAIEQHGTQQHSFTLETFAERYRANFGEFPL